MKKLILIAVMFCFTCVAEAKVLYNNSVLTDLHLNTIKGLLYDMTHPEKVDEKNKESIQQLLPKLSKAVVWLTNCHNSSTTYKLERIHSEESKIIKETITTIADVLQGKYSGFPVEKAMHRWTVLGSRVLVEYQIISKGSASQARWKFELKI